MEIQFDRRIYKKTAVNKAVRDYREFADFSVSEQDGRIRVSIDNIDYPSHSEFVGEFKNYVIHKMSVTT